MLSLREASRGVAKDIRPCRGLGPKRVTNLFELGRGLCHDDVARLRVPPVHVPVRAAVDRPLHRQALKILRAHMRLVAALAALAAVGNRSRGAVRKLGLAPSLKCTPMRRLRPGPRAPRPPSAVSAVAKNELARSVCRKGRRSRSGACHSCAAHADDQVGKDIDSAPGQAFCLGSQNRFRGPALSEHALLAKPCNTAAHRFFERTKANRHPRCHRTGRSWFSNTTVIRRAQDVAPFQGRLRADGEHASPGNSMGPSATQDRLAYTWQRLARSAQDTLPARPASRAALSAAAPARPPRAFLHSAVSATAGRARPARPARQAWSAPRLSLLPLPTHLGRDMHHCATASLIATGGVRGVFKPSLELPVHSPNSLLTSLVEFQNSGSHRLRGLGCWGPSRPASRASTGL